MKKLWSIYLFILIGCSTGKKDQVENIQGKSEVVALKETTQVEETEKVNLEEFTFAMQMVDYNLDTIIDTVGNLDFFLANYLRIEEADLPEYEIQVSKENYVVYSLGDKKVEFTLQDFDSSRHELELDKYGRVEKIDGKEFWGTDGDIPRKEISHIQLSKGDRNFDLPDSTFSNFYQPNLNCREDYCYTRIYELQNDNMLIRMVNSDGAGAYIAVLLLQNGELQEKKVDYGF